MEERLLELERRIAETERRFLSVHRGEGRATLLGLCLVLALSLLMAAVLAHCTGTLNALDGFARPAR